MNVRRAIPQDAEAISEIYNYYVKNTAITFEVDPVSKDEMAGRIKRILDSHEWLVVCDTDTIAGYAYFGNFRERSAYAHTVESTVYLDGKWMGKGLGRLVYQSLIDRAREMGFREMIGGIALPNEASIALHERLGFGKVGHFSKVGNKFGEWIDVGFWQLTL